MMKIGISANKNSHSYDRWGEKRYEKLKEHGFSAIDFGMADTGSVFYTSTFDEVKTILLHEKKLAENAGIEIAQTHAPWLWPPLLPELRDGLMEKIKKSIQFTSVLDCKYLVVHPISPAGDAEIGTPDEKITWDTNLEFMSELLKTAKSFGVTICLENMPFHKFSLSKPQDTLRFVNTINDENFKICLDTGHVSVFDELNPGDEVRRLGKQIKTFHIHDNRFGKDLHLPPFYGRIDWDDFAKALKDIDFDGVFSLELTPPASLPDNLFEDASTTIAKIAHEIIKKTF